MRVIPHIPPGTYAAWNMGSDDAPPFGPELYSLFAMACRQALVLRAGPAINSKRGRIGNGLPGDPR